MALEVIQISLRLVPLFLGDLDTYPVSTRMCNDSCPCAWRLTRRAKLAACHLDPQVVDSTACLVANPPTLLFGLTRGAQVIHKGGQAPSDPPIGSAFVHPGHGGIVIMLPR